MSSNIPLGSKVEMDSDAERSSESEPTVGVPSRYVDAATAHLNILGASFEDIQQSRLRASNRGDEFSMESLLKLEKQLSYQLDKALKTHALWPWLSQYKGLHGPRTARLIAAIGDPRRFPGQPCSEGHKLPPGFPVGSSCPITDFRAENAHESDVASGADGEADSDLANAGSTGFAEPFRAGWCSEIEATDGADSSPDTDETNGESEPARVRCPGIMLPPRTTTGTRSLWHYLGLHTVEGRLPKLRKGVQGDWNTKARTLILGPDGLRDQIVRQRTPKYRTIYDEAKARKLTLVDRPIQAEMIARTIAVKAFLGDLLAEWKRVVGEAEDHPEVVAVGGLADNVKAF